MHIWGINLEELWWRIKCAFLCILGCIILLGRTNMFRYNDPVEAAKLRKEGSRSHLSLSRLSLLSWSMPDLAWSSENLSVSCG
jgi:hypothetical protein